MLQATEGERTASAAQDLAPPRRHGRVAHRQPPLAEWLARAQCERMALAERHRVERGRPPVFLRRETARGRDEHPAKTDTLRQALTREHPDNAPLRRVRACGRDEAAELRGRLEVTAHQLDKLEQLHAALLTRLPSTGEGA